jgi:hypothetical protein
METCAMGLACHANRPGIFGVKATSLNTALAETYRHPTYSPIVLEF